MKETREQYRARKEMQRYEYEQRRDEKRQKLHDILKRKEEQFQKNQEFLRRLEDSIYRINDERYLAKGGRKDYLSDKMSRMLDKKDEVISQAGYLCRQMEEIREKLSKI